VFTGPASQPRAEVFVNQQLQQAAPQPRCSCRGLRGRPGGLGKRARISASSRACWLNWGKSPSSSWRGVPARSCSTTTATGIRIPRNTGWPEQIAGLLSTTCCEGSEIQTEGHRPLADQLSRPAQPVAGTRALQLAHQHLKHLLLLRWRKLQPLLTQAPNQLEIDQLAESELPCSPQGLAGHRSQHTPVFLMQQLRIGAKQRSASGCVEPGRHDAHSLTLLHLEAQFFAVLAADPVDAEISRQPSLTVHTCRAAAGAAGLKVVALGCGVRPWGRYWRPARRPGRPGPGSRAGRRPGLRVAPGAGPGSGRWWLLRGGRSGG